MRYVSVSEYCDMHFNVSYYDNVDNDQHVIKHYLHNIDRDDMNLKLYYLSKFDRSYCGDMEYLEVLMHGMCMRYFK